MPSPITLAAVVLTAALSVALVGDTPSPWSRHKTRPDESQGAVVAQVLGVDTWVQIAYHRPGVRDRDVWTATSSSGSLIVPRNGDPTPWRAGANEVTTIEFSGDVILEGHDVPAGKYSLFMIPGDETWTIVLNTDTKQWGSGRDYDAEKDVLRFDVKPEKAPMTEFLTYGFTNCEAWTMMAYMQWEKLRVAFQVEVPAIR